MTCSSYVVDAEPGSSNGWFDKCIPMYAYMYLLLSIHALYRCQCFPCGQNKRNEGDHHWVDHATWLRLGSLHCRHKFDWVSTWGCRSPAVSCWHRLEQLWVSTYAGALNVVISSDSDATELKPGWKVHLRGSAAIIFVPIRPQWSMLHKNILILVCHDLMFIHHGCSLVGVYYHRHMSSLHQALSTMMPTMPTSIQWCQLWAGVQSYLSHPSHSAFSLLSGTIQPSPQSPQPKNSSYLDSSSTFSQCPLPLPLLPHPSPTCSWYTPRHDDSCPC